jgi:hypothetical protein
MKQVRPVLVFAAASLSVFAAAKFETDSQAWWRHIEYLASDEMKGRNTGSPEHRKAAEYVASQFERAGLKPGGSNNYFQPVGFVSKTLDESKSSITLVTPSGEKQLKQGVDAFMSTRADLAEKLEAEVVFVGYGLRIPELKIDDFAGLDVKGKLLMTMPGVPAGVPSALISHYRSSAERAKLLRELGAVGSVGLSNPTKAEKPWLDGARSRVMPAMELADASLIETRGIRMSISVNPDSADTWLEGTGQKFSDLLKLDSQGKPMPKFPLKVKVRTVTSLAKAPLTSDNVIGVLPGTDPKLKDEVIVLSAHLDHVGTGPAVDGDSIYNGAMDNASGIATLIEVAAKLKGTKLKRTVAFVAVTGEEKGLLGSQYYSLKPTGFSGKIVANLNFDMFLPIVPPKLMTIYGIDESDLGDYMRRQTQKFGVELMPDPHPERNIFIRSDQYNFIKRGVPALSFKFTAKPGTPEAALLDQWMSKRYHAPSDDLKQPVSLEAASVFNDMMLAMVREVGNADQRPMWKQESFFKRFEK